MPCQMCIYEGNCKNKYLLSRRQIEKVNNQGLLVSRITESHFQMIYIDLIKFTIF